MDTFKQFYRTDVVEKFVDGMTKYHGKSHVNKFLNYHTVQIMENWMSLFPPPDMYEIWNRWINIGCPITPD